MVVYFLLDPLGLFLWWNSCIFTLHAHPLCLFIAKRANYGRMAKFGHSHGRGNFQDETHIYGVETHGNEAY